MIPMDQLPPLPEDWSYKFVTHDKLEIQHWGNKVRIRVYRFGPNRPEESMGRIFRNAVTLVDQIVLSRESEIADYLKILTEAREIVRTINEAFRQHERKYRDG